MKKWVLAALISVSALSGAFALASCTYKDGGHRWSSKWSHNERNHWHECLDDNCSQRSDLASHEWALDTTIESATCDAAGWGNYKCSVCGEKTEAEIPATGEHIWRAGAYRAPSCYLAGYNFSTCALCGTEKSEILPATGEHVFDETKWSSNSEGHYHTCTTELCTAKSEIVPHVKGEGSVKTKPQDFKDGLLVYPCTECGYEADPEAISATNIPTDLQVHLSPCYTKLSVYDPEILWPEDEPDPVITKEEDGSYSVTLVRDDGKGFPYTVSFTGKYPKNNGETTAVPVWMAVGSTYGVSAYRYNENAETRNQLNFLTSPSFVNGNDSSYAIMRFGSSATLYFVFETADNSDKVNLKQRTEIKVNVTVVNYGSHNAPTSYLNSAAAPVLYAELRRRDEQG